MIAGRVSRRYWRPFLPDFLQPQHLALDNLLSGDRCGGNSAGKKQGERAMCDNIAAEQVTLPAKPLLRLSKKIEAGLARLERRMLKAMPQLAHRSAAARCFQSR
jgi:hypothetical protein